MMGPYVYQENDAPTVTQSGDLLNVELNQFVSFSSDPTNTGDQMMWLPNHGAMSYWFEINNQPMWRTYMNILYEMVNTGCGAFTQEWQIAQTISTNQLTTASDINNVLLINNPASTQIQDAMWNDPYYGLSNYENYPRWQALQNTNTNSTAINKKLAWQAELRSYFGLSSAQVQELTKNWNGLVRTTGLTVEANLPSPVEYQNAFGFAYWQWATGQITQVTNSVASIALLGNNAFAGYYEITYFRSAYFNTIANAANVAYFAGINFYNSFFSTTSSNFENLFVTYDLANGVGTSPLSDSLFNVANMKQLVKLGMAAPNILTSPTTNYSSITLDPAWATLAAKLGLDQDQLYFLWLWLNTGYTQTFQRAPIGGDTQVAWISELVASSLESTISVMQLELPMLTLASQFNISYAANMTSVTGFGCNYFYTTVLQFPQTQADALCANAIFGFNFDNNNFQGYIQTAVALTNLYLYDNRFPGPSTDYYQVFSTVTGWNSIQITNMVHNPNSMATYFFMNEIEAPVYAHYSQPTVDGGLCDSQIVSQCAFSNLTYNQWLHGSVLYYPLPGLDIEPIMASYTLFYAGYSWLQYPPEVFYFASINQNDFPAEVSVADVYQGFNSTGLFNPTIIQNIWLDYMVPGWSNSFTSPYSLYYLRYVALNLGMGGLFVEMTPFTALQGYVSPFLEKMQSLPVYLGGSISPLPVEFAGVVNIDPIGYYTSTKPAGATYLMYPGTPDDLTQTRQISTWLGSDTVTLQGQEYVNLVSTQNVWLNPWPACPNGVPIGTATDGWQFATGIEGVETLSIYSPDLSRPLNFKEHCDGVTTAKFKGYDTECYMFDQS